MSNFGRLAAAGLAIAFLNLLLTLQNIWPTPWVRPTAEISIETAAIVLFLAIAAEARGTVSPVFRNLGIALLLILVTGRYADITAPALFGRPVDLFWDAPHLPRLAAMIVESTPLWQLALYTFGVLALIAAIVSAVARSVDALIAAFSHRSSRRGIAGFAALIVGLFGAGIGSDKIATEGWFSLPVSPVYVKQAAFIARATTADPAQATPLAESDLKRLGGADAFLMFFESYGAGVFETPRMKNALAADYTALNTFLEQSGWRTASAFIDSPTFGGASWLAHSTTLSGRWIAREADYRFFLAKPPETLVDRFRSAGYRSVLLLPGIQLDWPEGQALRFDRILDARTLDYKGPPFGWWTIPDQYSLETLHQSEFAQPNRQPLFVTFASIMSHMPFGPTPPYQPDWSRITTAEPFDPVSLKTALATIPDWDDLTAGYLRTIKYDLALLKGFLEKRAPKDAFIIVSGDHQPPAIISGRDASWSVPVHIFTRDEAIFDRFVEAGFKPGLHPARPALARMDAFNKMVLKALELEHGARQPLSRTALCIAILSVIANLAVWTWAFRTHEAPDWTGASLVGVSFSPYEKGQDPEAGDEPAEATIERDLDLLKASVQRIRTYSVLGSLGSIPKHAGKRGLTVTAGAWIGPDPARNRTEVDTLIALANSTGSIGRLLVGNEALLREDIAVDALISEIDSVQRKTTQPVSTAEPWHVWLAHPELAKAVDYIGVQILPYWEGVPVQEAVPYVLGRVAQLKATYPDKPIVLTEIGWPSAGRAIGGARASQVNQAVFLRSFLMAATPRNLDYFLIEAFDQPWKKSFEGMAGGYWGLFDLDRHAKFPWTGPVRERDDWVIWALFAALLGLIPALSYLALRPTARAQGTTLVTFIAQATGSALVWALFPAIDLYLSVLEFTIWAALYGAVIFLLLGVLVDTAEAADLLWTGPLRRRFTATGHRSKTFPKVSIHVPISNEPTALVHQTLSALASLDYPDFEVIVLDNNTDDPALWQPIEAHCQALGDHFRFQRYDRLKGYKGGALNRALEHSAPDAEILAIIDSDYVVARDWLASLVPLFTDPAIGFVQAPQDYRDGKENAFKSCCSWEYAGFFRIGMVRRNESDAIIQHGTMTLVRREALKAAGGWSDWCITEDAELGLRLAHTGWKSAYVAESFGKGVTPDSLDAYKLQRFRWAYGAMQILKRRWRWLLTGRDTKLSRGQRFHYLAGWLPWVADAAGLCFTAGAIVWTAVLTLSPETTELPSAAFLLPALAAFLLRQWRLFKLYGDAEPCGLLDRAKAALAGLALSHTVAKAVIWGLLTSSRPFNRTPKYRAGPKLLRGLAMASEEALILGSLVAVALGFVLTNGLWHIDAWLWLAVLALLALPYGATLVLAFINGTSQRATSKVGIRGGIPPIPAFPPGERRRKRRP